MVRDRLADFSWERMAAAVDAVRDRVRRIAVALEQARVPYAIVGGNAVAAWVARVDVEAVRNTKDVDILIRRADLPRVIEVAASAGFVHRNVNGVDRLLDGPEGGVRSAVHLVFAKEKIRTEHPFPAPDVTEAEAAPEFRVVALDALVRMKLVAYRLQDRLHVTDLFAVGLIDRGWRDRLPEPLGGRLDAVLDEFEREQ